MRLAARVAAADVYPPGETTPSSLAAHVTTTFARAANSETTSCIDIALEGTITQRKFRIDVCFRHPVSSPLFSILLNSHNGMCRVLATGADN